METNNEERERLRKHLRYLYIESHGDFSDIADFIIDDRERIVAPLVKSKYYHIGGAVLVDIKTVSDLLNIGCKVIELSRVKI